MRLGLVILLCALSTGCAIVRKDADEPVDNGPRTEKAEAVLKPSEVLKPDTREIASPINDHFAMRFVYFQPTVSTDFRLDSTNGLTSGTFLSAEKDLGLDDQINQGRVDFDLRMRERHHLRADFFKLSRFKEQPLAQDIDFGDFHFDAGTNFRTKLDWRVMSINYSYSFFKFERFEAGAGLGIHIIQAQAEGGEPGTLNREKDSEVGIFPTLSVSAAYRITKRFSITARGQSFSASPDGFKGKMSDYHADVQFRWHPNAAVGLGYTKLVSDLKVEDADQPLLFNLDTTGPELFVRFSF